MSAGVWEIHTQMWSDDRWGFWIVAPNNATLAKSTRRYTTKRGAIKGALRLVDGLRDNKIGLRA